MADLGAPSGAVAEVSTTAGTGAYQLGGALPGMFRFADFYGDGDTLTYAASDTSYSEIVTGRYDAVYDALSRDTVVMSNTGALISWPATNQRILRPLVSGASGVLNLKTQFGAKGDGSTNDATAIAAWVAAVLSTGRPGYAPAGTYKTNSQVLIDMKTVESTGFLLLGDGKQKTIFDVTGVSPPAGQGQFHITDTHASPNAFYPAMRDLGVKGNIAGPVFQIGDNSLTMPFNAGDFRQLWISNLSSSASAEAMRLNWFLNSNVDAIANCDGNGSSLVLRQAQFNLFTGSFSTADNGVYFTDAYNFGNVFAAVDIENVDLCVKNDSANTGINLFKGGTFVYNNHLASNSSGSNFIVFDAFNNGPNGGAGAPVDPSNYQWIVFKGVDLTTTPSVPATTTGQLNGYGCPVIVELWIPSGQSAAVSNINVSAAFRSRNVDLEVTLTNGVASSTVWLDPGDTITLTYTGSGLDWLWRAVL